MTKKNKIFLDVNLLKQLNYKTIPLYGITMSSPFLVK